MAVSSLRSASSSMLNRLRLCHRSISAKSAASSPKVKDTERLISVSDREMADLTSGISRPLSEILKELNKKVPDSLIKIRHEPNGFSVKYIPW